MDCKSLVEIALDVANADVLNRRLPLDRTMDPVDKTCDPPGRGSRPTRPPKSPLGLDESEEQLTIYLDHRDVAVLPSGNQGETAPVELLGGQPRLDPGGSLQRLDAEVLI